MEKKMSFVLKLSLEEMALRKIAVALCNKRHILYLIAKCKKGFGVNNIWSERKGCFRGVSSGELRRTIKDNMSKLQLPESLTRQMLPILKAVSSEIYTWKLLHEAYLSDSNEDFNVHVLENLCWTTAGAVDYGKTAEEIARSDVWDIVKRFELACFYCLENCIPVLWEELPEENKATFCKSRVETPHLQLFLPYILEKQRKLDSVSVNNVPVDLFKYSALCGYKTLTEYCFRKLTRRERDVSLIPVTRQVISYRAGQPTYRKEKLTDILCYLLSEMTPEEQIEIFKRMHIPVLRCFLDWPWKDLFVDIADVIWPFLPEEKDKYDRLLSEMDRRIDLSGYYFPKLIQEFFLRSPIKFKKTFLDGIIGPYYFFHRFFNNHDTETIKVIFRHVNAEDRARFVISHRHVIICWMDNWHVMEVLLREATLSREDKDRLKAALIACRGREGEIEVLRVKYRRFFEFAEETDVIVENKRSLEDVTSTKVKKPCCEKAQNSTE